MFCSKKIAVNIDNLRNIALSIIGLFGLLGVMLLSLMVILPIANAQEKPKSFTGGVSFSSASGDYDYQNTTASYSLGFDKTWGGAFFKTRFSTILTGTNYDLSVTQNLAQKDYDQAKSFDNFDQGGIFVVANVPPASRSYKTSKQVQDIEESLLEIGAGNNFKLVVGRIKNDWGVFDNNGPSLSPFARRQASIAEFLSTDRDAILAQDQVQFHLTSGIFTFEYYNFAPARTDEDFEKDQRERLVSGTYYTQIKPIGKDKDGVPVISDDIVADLRDIEFRTEDLIAPRLRKNAASSSSSSEPSFKYDDNPYTTDSEAFRVAVKPIWGQFAFTHHVGRDMTKPLLFSSFARLIDEGSREKFNVVFTNIPLIARDEITKEALAPPKNANYIFYPETIMDSFEADVPFGKKFRWRFESARFETIEGLGDNGRLFSNVSFPRTTENLGNRLNKIFELISDPNRDDEIKGSILYRAVKRTTAMGIDYQGETYQGELNFIHISAPAPINE